MTRSYLAGSKTTAVILTMAVASALAFSILLFDQHRHGLAALSENAQTEQQTLLNAVTHLHTANIEAYVEKFVAGDRNVMALLEGAQNPANRDQLRPPLQTRMIPVMSQLRLSGVDIFTFRLPDHETLLRVHMPDTHGDRAEAERVLIREAAASGQPQHGFELGRLAPAYRSILPIIHEKLGLLVTLDIGVPMRRLIHELRAMLPQREVFVILPASERLQAIVEAEEWPYAPWPGSEHFFIDLAPASTTQTTQAEVVASDLLNSWRTDARIQTQLRSLAAGSLELRDGQDGILTQTPIIDSRGKILALLVSYGPEPGLGFLRNQFRTYLLLGLTLIGILAFLSLKLARSMREKLAEGERLLAITHSMGSGLLVTDGEGRFKASNPYARQLLVLEGDEVLGQSAADLLGLSVDHDVELLAALAGTGECRTELSYRHPDGTERILHIVTVPLSGQNEGSAAVSLLDDITERKRTQEQLQLAGTVFSEAREGIIITDAEANILDVNAAFSRITGYSREDVLAQRPSLLRSDVQNEAFYNAMWARLREQGSWQGELWNRRKDGELYPEKLSISAVESIEGKPTHYVAMFSDISREKTQERELRRIALYDPLTGLPNRALLTSQMGQVMQAASENRSLLALAIVDLDGFKKINDEHGREIGDELLIEIAERIRARLRDSDIVARLGGDEFVIVLTDLALSNSAQELLSEVLQVIAEPVRIEQHRLSISGSIGFTLFPQAGEVDAEQLLRQADQAMYRAKVAGKNRVHEFNVSEDSAVRGRMEQIDLLRAALIDRQFCLYYQPKVNLNTGEVFGAEALLRWQHPEEGLLAPGRFLPMLAGDPLEIELGRWVLKTAIEQASQWHRNGMSLEISINIAGPHLQDAGFCKELGALLDAHPNLPAAAIQLEIIESSALADIDQVSDIMHRCTALGVQFALDDFGTGYSSLTYLKRLPAETLKIDQSFVRDMRHDANDLTIVDGILNLARAFERQCLAEGVETVEDGILLIQFGCNLAQGYGIARPMPASALPGWARKWQPAADWVASRLANQRSRELIYGVVEHRGWMAALRDHFAGACSRSPAIDPQQCRLGTRLSSTLTTTLDPGLIERLDQAHRRLHELAAELVDQYSTRDHQSLAAGLPALEVQSDRLVMLLQTAINQLE